MTQKNLPKEIRTKIKNFLQKNESVSFANRKKQIKQYLQTNSSVTFTKRINNIDYPIIRVELPIEYLYLDDKNRRDWSLLSKSTYNQFELYLLLEEQSMIKKLFQNGGVMDEIYAYADGRIPEGNRRAATIIWLHHQYPNDKRFQTIPTLLLPDNITSNMDFFLLSTHVDGKKRWGTWEEVSFQSDAIKDGKSKIAIATHIGISIIDLNRKLETFAFVERYGEYNKTDPKYKSNWSFFEESIDYRNQIIDTIYFRDTYGKFERGNHNSFDTVPLAVAAFKGFIETEIFYLLKEKVIFKAHEHPRKFHLFMSNNGNGLLWGRVLRLPAENIGKDPKQIRTMTDLVEDLSTKSRYSATYNKCESIAKSLLEISNDDKEMLAFVDGDRDIEIHLMMDTIEKLTLFLSDKRLTSLIKRCNKIRN